MFNGAETDIILYSPRPYSIHVRVKSAAAFNDDAPQYQLQLRHDDEQQQDSAGRTKTNPERLDMSATG
ncbi:hypothetical protein ACHAO8_005108 [Botrytis cinerea]